MGDDTTSPRKAKIANRMIEVLDYFDADHREATVMEIARRYDRPQSSTSDLLASLVDLGLLHRDLHARTYSLAPRAALLGTAGQPEFIRDGRIVRLMDRLVAQTGLAVGLHAILGPDSQVVSWRQGPRAPISTRSLRGGMRQPLSQSAAGWLLLSTVERPHRDRILRRLNAEADDDAKFPTREMMARIDACYDTQQAQGPAGFGTGALAVSGLIQPQGGHALAISIVYDRPSLDAQTLLQCIRDAVGQCLPDPQVVPCLRPVPHAA